MSQTDHIDWKHILSRVCVLVGPTNFLYAKNTQNYREYRVARSTLHLNEAATGLWSPAEPAKRGVNSVMVGRHQPIEQQQHGWVCVLVHECVRDVLYDNNIW